MIKLKTSDWQISDIDTIIFDKDGTFIDLHYFWGKMTELRVLEIIKQYNLNKDVFQKFCLELGYDPTSGKMLPDGITALYSRPIIIDIFCKYLVENNVNITPKDMETIFDKVSADFYKDMTKYTKPINSAINFIKDIKSRGIKTAIVTSDATESTLLTLKHFGWENLFDTVMGRESTKETKESGVPVKTVLNILGSNPENTVMIGDAPTDYTAAFNGGVAKTILVATGQVTKENLAKTSPYTIDSLEDIEIV